MARQKKAPVRFEFEGKQWHVIFYHEHCGTDCDGRDEPLIYGTLKLRHITSCTIFSEDKAVMTVEGVGRSRCSIHDDYDWKLGIKRAFMAALAAMNPQPQNVNRFIGAFFEARKGAVALRLTKEEVL